MSKAILRIAVCWCLVVAATVALAVLRVCVKCGYENADSAVGCTHCGATLPPLPADKPVEAAPPRPAGVEGRRIEDEIQLALKHFLDGQADLAWLLARNAAALETIAAPADLKRSASVADLLQKCRAASRTMSRKCPDCGGSGKQDTRLTGLDGETRNLPSFGKACAACGGSGFVTVPATVSETKRARGEALRAYTVMQRGRQFKQIGNAWVPPELGDALTMRQTAALLTATASPCAACMGLGREDCSACGGLGQTRCPNAKCVKGWVIERRQGELAKTDFKRKVRCERCGGNGIVVCADCRGAGSVVCKACDGQGERALCTKCNGQGTAVCRRCKGGGQYRGGACTECAGAGLALCKGCNGDGRAK